jgi:hypothetical protein
MTQIKDVAGFPQFAQRVTNAAADISLALAGENDAQVQAALNQTRSNLIAKLSKEIGAKLATAIADAFVDAVRRRRREIENHDD